MSDERELLERLGRTVARVVESYRSADDLTVMVNSTWTARDVLVHVLLWHESFARNVSDLARGIKPTPLKGTYADLGRKASEQARDLSVETLLERLIAAQRTIEKSIFNPKVGLIPYKVGSRPYPPAEHLRIVDEHVSGHIAKVRSAMDEMGST